jgi:hypothetical protein
MEFWCITLCALVGWYQRILKMETAGLFEKMVAVHQGTRPGTHKTALRL